MNKKQIRNSLIVAVLVSILCATTYYVGVSSVSYPGTTSEVWVNPPFSEASYVVGQYNSTYYYAKNGMTGKYDFLSSNARAVINNVFGNITAVPPQKIVVLIGNFTLDGALVVGSYTYVDATQAVLIMGVGVSSDTVQFASGATMSEWHGGLIVGNGG